MENKKIRNNTIDAFRFIAVVMVVFIHYPFPGHVGVGIKALARISVPIFFMISGYYAYKIEPLNCKKYLSKKIRSNLNRIIIASGICLVLEYLVYHRDISVIVYFSRLISIKGILRLIFLNDTGRITHLWFLIALLYCHLFLWLIVSLISNRNKCILVVLICTGVCMLLLCEILPIFNIFIDHCYYRNAILEGIFFYLLGFQFNKFDLHNKLYLLSVFLGFIVYIIEYIILGEVELSVGISLIAVGVFLFGIEYSECIQNKIVIGLGRNCSFAIYVIHWYVMCVEYKLISRVSFLQIDWYLYISPIMVVIYSIAVSLIFIGIINFWRSNIDGKQKVL